MRMSMKSEFQRILLNHNTKGFKYLLAISGGVDSMVLLDLFRHSVASFQVAHCNFQLRENDSIQDQLMVQQYCGRHQIPFHTINFDVEAFKATGNYSTEMACRLLRYRWFDEIMQVNHLDYLVTAHHLDDNIETFLINLSRGTGVSGLRGMKILSHQNIFRPLLNFTKECLLTYAHENSIHWREDSSNGTDDYTRNKIRHHITPLLRELHPQFDSNFKHTLNILSDTEDFILNQIQSIRNDLIPHDFNCKIKISALDQLKPKDFIQFYLFDYYGFKDVDLINQLKQSDNSSELRSKTHRLIKEREYLILTQLSEIDSDEIIIEQEEVKINSLNLKFVCSNGRLDNASEILDGDQIQYPIRLRKAKEGDFFYPLGMNGKRKLISKFFKDLKFSKIEKEDAWLLVDNQDQILWVVNHRIDHRFRIKEHSMNFLNIIVC